MENQRGIWSVKKGRNCQIRLLTKPSQAFRDWQASNPPVEIVPVRDLHKEVDEIKARIGQLEKI
ncbi:unnamed protein product [marine sediment metagenome]|uniref:Uncharacterized protein n=1 Tax=marine sediment metagenome TaxID=412755 RepID=X1QQN8_9ZZZZ